MFPTLIFKNQVKDEYNELKVDRMKLKIEIIYKKTTLST